MPPSPARLPVVTMSILPTYRPVAVDARSVEMTVAVFVPATTVPTMAPRSRLMNAVNMAAVPLTLVRLALTVPVTAPVVPTAEAAAL